MSRPTRETLDFNIQFHRDNCDDACADCYVCQLIAEIEAMREEADGYRARLDYQPPSGRTAEGDSSYLELLMARRVPIETRSEDVLIAEVCRLRAEFGNCEEEFRKPLRDIIARAEALPNKWRLAACPGIGDVNIAPDKTECADELEAALRGPQ